MQINLKIKRIVNSCLILFSLFIFSSTVNAQYSTYSYKNFGFDIKFPSDWQVINQPELTHVLSVAMSDADKSDSTMFESMLDDSIVTFVYNKSALPPNYSIVIVSEKIVEENKELQSNEYLTYGIQYMLQQGLQIPEYTQPIPYVTPTGIAFYTCQMKMVSDGSTTYKRNFVVRRPNDFLVITGSFPSESDDGWFSKVVDSIVLTQ